MSLIYGRLMGGMGNNLFQIAAISALAKTHNISFGIGNIPDRGEHGMYNGNKLEIPDIFVNSDYLVPVGMLSASNTYYHKDITLSDKRNFLYNELPLLLNYTYCGYFQSPKYFPNIDVCKLFEIKPNLIEFIKAKYPNINNSASIHFRIGGDRAAMKDVQLYHTDVSLTFYKNAISHIPKNVHLYIITDCVVNAKVVDILNEVAPERSYTIITDMIEGFVTMTQTKYNIIGNSTFSWWGAYLGEQTKNTQLVVAPKSEFLGIIHRNNGVILDDLFPSNWITY